MSYRVIWGMVAPALLVGYGWLCAWFILPFMTAVNYVLYEPIGYMTSILFAGFLAFLVIFSHRFFEVVLLKDKTFPKKLTKNMFLLGALLGFFLNHATLFFIIKPNHMVECPLETGYKNNLMSKYVFDTKECLK
ncbi:hypothetical protein [Vibrio coralliilyticus]|uniref:hypothetical protein n=1 Tax=Vibrio coralliilyticus TaxID=190893 RepID=UPI00185359A2|nr:hypothetical protein [Vibrio coralliilyticus]NUW66938.1 hypothetical protein [Vibrio coralliilyticus]